MYYISMRRKNFVSFASFEDLFSLTFLEKDVVAFRSKQKRTQCKKTHTVGRRSECWNVERRKYIYVMTLITTCWKNSFIFNQSQKETSEKNEINRCFIIIVKQ